MPPSMPNTPGPESPAALGHEPHRVSGGAIVACGVALAVLLVVVHFVLSGFVATLEPAAQTPTPGRRVFPQDIDRIRPPVLQASNDDDLIALRKKEQTILDGYRWVDRPKGVVGIPITRAMELLVKEKGR